MKEKRKGIKGKDKGSGFELKIAKRFTEWSGVKFQRVPLSGGWNKVVVSGDIFCEPEYEPSPTTKQIVFPLSIECKNDESWELVQLFKDTDKSPIRLFWDQAINDALETNKIPALIFSRNWVPDFIMLKVDTLNQIAKKSGSSWKKLLHMTYPMSEDCQVAIMTLDLFFEWITFSSLLKLSS